MATHRTAIQRERFRFYLRILGISGVVGAVYGATVSQPGLSIGLSMVIGAVNGAGIVSLFVLGAPKLALVPRAWNRPRATRACASSLRTLHCRRSARSRK
jgi:hypothetical protein